MLSREESCPAATPCGLRIAVAGAEPAPGICATRAGALVTQSHPVGLVLESATAMFHAEHGRNRGSGLLHGVGEFVRQQALAASVSGAYWPASKTMCLPTVYATAFTARADFAPSYRYAPAPG